MLIILILFDFVCTPEHSVERMMWEDYLITKCYSDKIPVVDCAVEVGFGCG